MEVAKAYKDTKIGRIPKDWELLPVGKCILKKKFSVGKLSKKDYFKTGSFPIIDQSKTFIIGYTNRSELLYSGNLPAIIYGDHTNHVKYVDFPFVCGADGVKIIQPLTELDNKFIYYSIFYRKPQSEGYKRHFSILKEKDLCIPPVSEQQKIAEILSTVDEQISTTQAIIDKSKELKKGLMQKLFSEGIGHTEFKDTKIGRIPKDWDIVTAQDICEKVTDGTHDSPKRVVDGYKLVTSKNLKNGELDFSTCYNISEKDYKEVNKRSYVEQYDVLFGMIGTIGSPVMIQQKEIDFAVKNVGIFKTRNDVKLGTWLCHFFNSYVATNFIKRQKNSSTQSFVALGFLRKFPILNPPIEERDKISDILTAADSKIEKEEHKKAKLRELKKGLMQQLLTGKKRVKV